MGQYSAPFHLLDCLGLIVMSSQCYLLASLNSLSLMMEILPDLLHH